MKTLNDLDEKLKPLLGVLAEMPIHHTWNVLKMLAEVYAGGGIHHLVDRLQAENAELLKKIEELRREREAVKDALKIPDLYAACAAIERIVYTGVPTLEPVQGDGIPRRYPPMEMRRGGREIEPDKRE